MTAAPKPSASPVMPNAAVIAGAATCCASCNAYEDRLEEIRMAVTLDRTKSNPYGRTTIEYAIWELRQTIDNLRKQNRHDRKQWKHEVRERRNVRLALLRFVESYDAEPVKLSGFIANGDTINRRLAKLLKLGRELKHD